MALATPSTSPVLTITPVSRVISSGLAVALYTIPGVPQAKPSTVVRKDLYSL